MKDSKMTTIETAQPHEMLKRAVFWLCSVWKDAIVSNENGTEVWSLQQVPEILFADHVELFVFPSKASFDSSDVEDYPSFFAFTCEEGEFTVFPPSESVEAIGLLEYLRDYGLQTSRAVSSCLAN